MAHSADAFADELHFVTPSPMLPFGGGEGTMAHAPSPARGREGSNPIGTPPPVLSSDHAAADDDGGRWGLLRSMTTFKEYKLLHRIKDGIRDCYTIGRNSTCDIVLTDKRVSGNHCVIYCDYSQSRLRVYVEDTSSNGTYINGLETKLNKHERTELRSGDEVHVIHPKLVAQPQEDVGPFLFINMRDRVMHERKVLRAPDPVSRRAAGGGRHIEDEYIIGEQLGSGMCGQVHRCYHRVTKQAFAVKVINTRKFLRNPGLSPTDLREEAEIMRTLNHPNIVRVQDAFECDGVIYIVMELVSGGDLFDKIIAKGRYDENAARLVLVKVLDAVRYMHGQKIVHRDLKPENILLSGTADDADVKITDFGLAKRASHEGLRTFCGTPQYFAPEVLRRKAVPQGSVAGGVAVSRYGEKADIWSIGVITYIMLSGSFPFDEDNLFDQIEAGQYSLAGTEWSTVSSLAKHFIRSLMTMEIDQRCDVQGAIDHEWIQSYLKKNENVRLLSEAIIRPPACVSSDANEGEDLINAATKRSENFKPEEVINEEPSFSNIFWSNKAAIVKLASMKSKVVSMKSDSGFEVPAPNATAGSTAVANRSSIRATQDLIRKKSALEPLTISSTAVSRQSNASEASASRSKKRQHIEPRVLSDDEIDEEFSDDDALPPLAGEVVVPGKRRRRTAAASKATKAPGESPAAVAKSRGPGVVSPLISSEGALPTDPAMAPPAATGGPIRTSGAALVTPEIASRPALQKVGTIDKYFSKSSPRAADAPISAVGAAVTPRLPTKTISDAFDASHKRIL